MGQIEDEAVDLLLYTADDYHCLAEVTLGVAWWLGQRHEHLPGPAAMVPDIVLDNGIPAIEAVLVPELLVDALGGVPLLLGDAAILFEDAVDDAGEGLLLSLSKAWDAAVGPFPGSPAARSRPASCAPCLGADRTPGKPPGCSSPPPSPPGESAGKPPPRTSVAPSVGSATTLMNGGGRSNFQLPFVSRSIRLPATL